MAQRPPNDASGNRLAEIPLRSGRTWERLNDDLPPESTSTNVAMWLRCVEEQDLRARFKWPLEMMPEGIYTMGMERVAFRLGRYLDLPIPNVFLETLEEHAGSLTLSVGPNSRTYQQALGGAPMMLTEILDEDRWPLYVSFDLWMANADRDCRNLMLNPEPPDRLPQRTVQSRTWLIDHGGCGLWYPGHIDPEAKTDVERVRVGQGDLTAEGNNWLRGFMPDRYRNSFARLNADERRPFLDLVRGIADDVIVEAVCEVPAKYISEPAKNLTIQFLRLRRDRIYTLSRDVFPAQAGPR